MSKTKYHYGDIGPGNFTAAYRKGKSGLTEVAFAFCGPEDHFSFEYGRMRAKGRLDKEGVRKEKLCQRGLRWSIDPNPAVHTLKSAIEVLAADVCKAWWWVGRPSPKAFRAMMRKSTLTVVRACSPEWGGVAS